MGKKSTIGKIFSWLIYKADSIPDNADKAVHGGKENKADAAGRSHTADGYEERSDNIGDTDRSRKAGGSQSTSSMPGNSQTKKGRSGSSRAWHGNKAESGGRARHENKAESGGQPLHANKAEGGSHKNAKSSDDKKTKAYHDLEKNLSYIEHSFNHPDNKDIVIRRLCIGNGVNAFIFYLDGMTDRSTINLSVLRPLLDRSKYNDLNGKNLFDYVYESVIETHQLEKADTHEKAINDVLTGNTAICIDGYPNYILCETKGFDKRNVDKPQVEGVVKGSQEAYNENLRTNITLIRKILKNKGLTTEFFKLGERNNEQIAVVYLKDLADPSLVAEIKRRIKGLVTDLILGDGVLEHFIEDNPYSIFPTIISTERPDRTVAHLTDGKVAILADGTPFALIVPVTVFDFLNTPEDTSLRWQFGTFIRFVRLFAVFVASLLPGLYVALTTFHREMIPTDLLIAIAQAKENVPFPTLVEVILMELSFELIREAGIRIPGIIGNTIGIIGALILGQAAVQANLVSPVLIIVVAFTGLGNFAIPDFNLAFSMRIMRVLFIFSGAFLGFFGISLALVILLAFGVSQKSFGVPFFTQIAPATRKSSDLLIRLPIWQQELRPDYANPLDIRRQPEISRKWILSNRYRSSGQGGSKK